MESLLGIFGLCAAILWSFCLSLRAPKFALVILIALVVRVCLALFHFYVAPLPDGSEDAFTYERVAWQYGFYDLNYIAQFFPGPRSEFYPWAMANIYSVFGRSLLLLQSFSIIVGVSTVYIGARLSERLWGEAAGKLAGVAIALYPTMMLYSVLPMRESYFSFFLILGVYFYAIFLDVQRLYPLILSVFAIVISSFFHAAGFVALLSILLFTVAYGSYKSWCAFKSSNAIIPGYVLTIISFFVISSIAIIIDPELNKFGKVSDAITCGNCLEVMQNRASGNAVFPAWTLPETQYDLIWAIPLRILYFSGSPFFWDVSAFRHMFGLIDGLICMFLYFGIFNVFFELKKKNVIFIFLIFLIGLLLIAFAIGTANFGTAVRHRSKLIPLLIVASTPFLMKFRFR